MRLFRLFSLIVITCSCASASPSAVGRQSAQSPQLSPTPARGLPPAARRVIDMHLHALGPAGNAAMVAAMDSLNVTTAVFLGTPDMLSSRPRVGAANLIPALTLPCEGGRLPTSGAQCFPGGAEWPDTADLRARIARGEIKALGEITAQYAGIPPDDPRLEPYLAIAAELDVPVGIHLGFAAPGVAYAASRFPPHKSPNYSGRAGSPLLLEPVLTRFPKLRLYVMHAAWPFEEEMIYMLYMHPQLYVDVSVLQWAIPRPAYYSYLRRLVDAGFGKRIMFGSDGSARHLRAGIEAIENAVFLTETQKIDILYGNAARFLKLEGAGSS